jgi:protein associated with RNAse G/E
MYINVASPFIFEEGAIKYIDLDIDFVTNDVFSIP